jgi:hypothetical protein
MWRVAEGIERERVDRVGWKCLFIVRYIDADGKVCKCDKVANKVFFVEHTVNLDGKWIR